MSTLLEALEEALAENPDDLASHAACADHLQELGDPRGEFIQVQLALERQGLSAAERNKLHQRERDLLRQHQHEWLGELAGFLVPPEDRGKVAEPFAFGFSRGWLDYLHVNNMTVNLARALVRSPQTRLLRELFIDYVAGEGDQPPYTPGDDVPDSWERDQVQFFSLHPLVRSPHLTNVRRFRLGHDETGADYETFEGSYTLGIAAVDLIAKMPHIEEIRLFTRGVDLDRLFGLPGLGRLRVLQVYHMNQRHRLELLVGNPALSGLTHLMFHPHYHEDFYAGHGEIDPAQAYLTLEDVRALVASPHLGSLRYLQLRLCSMGDEGCREIVRSGMLGRLKVLDLRHGRITDAGARTLASCPELRNLELLDIDRNALTAAGIEALRQTGVPLRAGSQMTAQEAEESQYLFEGDFE